MNKTAKWWRWFVDDRFFLGEVIDEKEKCIHYDLHGKVDLTDHENVDDWLGLIEYQVIGKGTHEQFSEATLVSRNYDALFRVDSEEFVRQLNEEQGTVIIQLFLKNEIAEEYRV
jgi:hypothetical protein